MRHRRDPPPLVSLRPSRYSPFPQRMPRSGGAFLRALPRPLPVARLSQAPPPKQRSSSLAMGAAQDNHEEVSALLAPSVEEKLPPAPTKATKGYVDGVPVVMGEPVAGSAAP